MGARSISFCIVLALTLTLIGHASAQACLTGADEKGNCDGMVDITELMDYIGEWYKCSTCIPDFFNAIQAYYGIPFCDPEYTEECNGFDDNCDGQVDEGFDEDDCHEKCTVEWTGNGGSLNCCGDDAGEAGPFEAVEVSVDGNDNDCDGEVDEGGGPVEGASTLIDLNPDGISYGHELLFKVYSTGEFDEFGSVVVENNIGYVCGKTYGAYDGIRNITAFNAITGDIIWSTYIGDCDGAPLIDNQNDDYIYINTYDYGTDGLFKLDKADGSIICSQTAGSNGMVESLAQSDDLVFGNGYGHDHLHAFFKADCSIAWEYVVPAATTVIGTPFYWEDRVISMRYSPGMIFQVNATTGDLIWSTDAPNDFWDVQPSIRDGIIYAGNGRYGTGSVAAYDFTDGSIIWEELGLGPILSQAAIYDNRIWVGGKGNTLYSLNIDDGSINCTFLAGHDFYQGPAITNAAGGLVLIGNRDSYLYLINATDCSEIWKFDVGGGIFSSPAIARGNIYVATDSWYTYAFDFGLGTGDWKYLGYNASGHSYCHDCLTTWENVKASCTTSGNITCTVTNQYSHSVANITLKNGGKVNWYNPSGTLLKSKSDSYTITAPLASSSSVGFILETPVAEEGYISWWKFDGDAADEAGMNDGTLTGDAVITNYAERGQVLSLDGDGDFVDVGNDASLWFTNDTDFSISAWVYKLDGTDQMGIATKGGNTDRYMLAYTSNSWRFEIRDGSNYVLASSSDPNPANRWVHLVGVYDSLINNLSLYVDGELEDSDISAVLDDFTDTASLKIGHFRYSTPVWNGSIDDVMIYNRALSGAEIAEIYHAQSPDTFPADYVAYWRLEGSAADETGTNDGTLIGDAVIVDDAEKGQAVSLDGDGDAITVPDSASLSPSGTALTLSAWVYCDGPMDTDDRIIHKNSAWSLQVGDPCDPLMGMYHGGYTETPSPVSCDLNEWCFITGVYNGTHISTYKNSVLITSLAKTGNMAESAVDLYIGIDEDGAFGAFNGTIDDVMIYDRALSGAEIEAIYLSQSP